MKSAVVALAATGVAAAALPLSAGPATADPALINTFAIPGGVSTNSQIAADGNGDMWIAVDAGGDYARITQAGAVQVFDAANVNNPVGMTRDADGNMWVTQNGSVAMFDPATPGTATKTDITGLTAPRAITAGPDGKLWTVSDDKVFRIPPSDPSNYTTFTMGGGVSGARWITSSAASIWVAYNSGGAVMQVNPATGVGTPHPATGGMQGIAAGDPVGGVEQVGFTQSLNAPQYVARLSPSGTPQTIDTPLADPFGIAFGNDKAYWIAQFAGDALGRLTQDGTYTKEAIKFDTGSGPRQLALGPDNTLWVSLDTADKIAKIGGVAPPPTPPGPSPTPPGPTPPVPTPATVTATITKGPKKAVKTRKAKAKVRFTFGSTPAGATFQCRIKKGRKFTACKSPKTYKLKVGKYRFAVRALLPGAASAKPAVRKFKVVRR